MKTELIGKSQYDKVDVPQMVEDNCTHAIIFQDGEISVSSMVYSSLTKNLKGLLCPIDMEHNMDESRFSENYTVADWVDDAIGTAIDRLEDED